MNWAGLKRTAAQPREGFKLGVALKTVHIGVPTYLLPGQLLLPRQFWQRSKIFPSYILPSRILVLIIFVIFNLVAVELKRSIWNDVYI